MNYLKSRETIKNLVVLKTTKFLFLSFLASNILLSQQADCDLLFCGSLSGFKAVLSEGDRVAFGYDLATIEGIYELNNQGVWRDWYDEQYGIRDEVSMIRYIYDAKKNGKTVVIETFYNRNEGEFLFGRVLYQGNYAQDDMKNFMMKLYYTEARLDFDQEEEFKDNSRSFYFDNADVLLKSLTRYIDSL